MKCITFNYLWPGDTMWWQIWVNIGSGNDLMPNVQFLLISFCAFESNFTVSALAIILCDEFENNNLKLKPFFPGPKLALVSPEYVP